MTSTEQRERAVIAFTRFGLGATSSVGLTQIESDPIGAILEELENPTRAIIRDRELPGYAAACAVAHTSFEAEDQLMKRELSARVEKHRTSQIGFLERLVMFWSNHFNMTVAKNGAVRATIGQYERDVVRRRFLGSFEGLLRNTIRHPAMMAYLDNADSIGPNSAVGRSTGRGINVNLAREILELHTVGVGAGYTEIDIRNMAYILSGWSYVRGWEARANVNGGNAANHGQFIYRSRWHEPGGFTVLGRRYRAVGERQGQRVIRDLSRHPATAQFIAYKLVHHFLTDNPTPDLVDPVKRAFLNSEGDLKETARALVQMPASWSLPLAKLRRPYELLVAQLRALEMTWHPEDLWRLYEALHAMGNKPWMWTAPNGYPDSNEHWESPDGIRVRADSIQMTTWALTNREGRSPSALDIGSSLFGPLLSATTQQALRTAANAREALTLLFLSPEFQRR